MKKHPKDITRTYELNGAEAFVLVAILNATFKTKKIIETQSKLECRGALKALDDINYHDLFDKFFDDLHNFGFKNKNDYSSHESDCVETIEICGYDVKFRGGLVHFGCKKLTVNEAKTLAASAKTLIGLTGENFAVDHNYFNLTDVEKFYQWLEKIKE